MTETELQAMSRAELHRHAADAIAAEGRKPSISSLRQWTLLHAGIKRGSDTDTQADVTAWWRDLLALKNQKRIADVPESISSLATTLWKAALEAAEKSLASQWSDLAEARFDMQRQIDLANAAEQASKGDAARLRGELEVAHATSAGKEDAIAQLRGELAAARATLGAKDQRIEGLASDFARKSQENATAVQQLDDLRRSSLVQIDEARQEGRHWRGEFHRVDEENRSALQKHQLRHTELQSQMAEARGRMSAFQESLTEQQERNRELENALTLAKADAASAQTMSPARRRGRPRLGRSTVTRRRP